MGSRASKGATNPSGLQSREERDKQKFAEGNQRMHRSPLVNKTGLGRTLTKPVKDQGMNPRQ